VEAWAVSEDARSGYYVATVEGASLTRIWLADGKVAARKGNGKTVHANEPDNYIPEGLMTIAIRRAARLKREAQFSVVLNERVGSSKLLEFDATRVKGRDAAEDGGVKARRKAYLGRTKIDIDYEFDAEGRLQSRSVRGLPVPVKVVAEEVFQAFPSAQIEMLSAMGKWKAQLVRDSWGRPTTRPATQPAD